MDGLIQIFFTATVDGIHEVCVTSPIVNCQQINCISGEEYNVNFPYEINNYTCSENVLISGSIKPECSDFALPLNNVIPIVPPCNSWLFECYQTRIGSLAWDATNGSYDPNNPPGYTWSGGGPGAIYPPTQICVSNGSLMGTATDGPPLPFDTMQYISHGSGYATGTYQQVSPTSNTGIGTGLRVDIVCAGGQVTVVQLDGGGDGICSIGQGYQVGDVLGFDIGGGTGCLIEIISTRTGHVDGIAFDQDAQYYTEQVYLNIDPPPGGQTGIEVDVDMVKCPPRSISGTCVGNFSLPASEVGTKYYWCSNNPQIGIGDLWRQTQITQEDFCCYECVVVRFSSDLESGVTVRYASCDTQNMVSESVPGNGQGYIERCVVNHSWFSHLGGLIGLNATVIGNCEW